MVKNEPMLRRADDAELELFYSWIRRQFHPDEIKPLARIRQMIDVGIYAAYGLWDGENLIAYALTGHTPDKRNHMLEYYAVLPEYQDAGWGSRFLGMLREGVDGDVLLVEVEDPGYVSDEAEREHCFRRMRFYERNGFRQTSVSLSLFGFAYAIMALPLKGEMTDEEVHGALDEIYHLFYPPVVYQKNVRFRKGW